MQASAAAASEAPSAHDTAPLLQLNGTNGSGLKAASDGGNRASGKKPAAAAAPAAPAAAQPPAPAPGGPPAELPSEKQPRSLKKLRAVVADLKEKQESMQQQMGSAAQVRWGPTGGRVRRARRVVARDAQAPGCGLRLRLCPSAPVGALVLTLLFC